LSASAGAILVGAISGAAIAALPGSAGPAGAIAGLLLGCRRRRRDPMRRSRDAGLRRESTARTAMRHS